MTHTRKVSSSIILDAVVMACKLSLFEYLAVVVRRTCAHHLSLVTSRLDFFTDYWNTNRVGVARDAAHLFSGTGLECSDGSCVIGCAYVGATCSGNAYGVNYASYSDNTVKQAQLVSHEIGHNVGANHDSGSTDYIMYPSNGGNERYFSSQTIASFDVPRNALCLDFVGATPPPPTTTPPPPVGGDFAVQIQVVHDDYPEETSWTLADSDGNVLASQAINSGIADGTVINQAVPVDAGEYTFTISDSYGDGICCDYGTGSFSVKVGSTTLLSGGGFGTSGTVTFTICPNGDVGVGLECAPPTTTTTTPATTTTTTTTSTTPATRT